MVETLDRPLVAAERIVDHSHRVAHRDVVGVGEGDLIEGLQRLRIFSRPKEQRAAVIPDGDVRRLGGGDPGVAAGGILEPAEVLERPGSAVERIEVVRFRIEHAAKCLDGFGVISPVQESGPDSCERIGVAGVRPVDPLKAGRRFAVVTGPLEHPPVFLPEDNILRVSSERSLVSCRRVGIPAEPLKHLCLPVRGVRICGFSFDDLLEASGSLFVVAGQGEDVSQSPQCPGIAGRRLDSLPQPPRGFVVLAETAKRLAHEEPDLTVFRFDLERLLETFHRLAVVSGLKLRDPLLY